jgi:hypothetical protein
VGYAFVSQYLGDMFPDLLDLDSFNTRRRELIAVIEAIRRDVHDQLLDSSDSVCLVDSAPVTLMTYTRGARMSQRGGHSILRRRHQQEEQGLRIAAAPHRHC